MSAGFTTEELLYAALEGTLDPEGNIVDAAGGGQQDETPDEPEMKLDPEPGQDDGRQVEPAASDKVGDGKAAHTEAEEQPGAPIQSKSGSYTIPYQKLVDARTERDSAIAKAEMLERQLAELTASQQANLAQAQSNAQARADAGAAQTAADQNLAAAEQALASGVDMAVFGDYSEESIAKGLAELNRRYAEQVRAEVQAEVQAQVQKALGPHAKREADAAHEEFFGEVLKAHPDAIEALESQEFSAWLDGLPVYARAGAEHTISNGTPQQIVEVLDAFRSTVKTAPQPQAAEAAAAQQTATQKAAPEAQRPRVPVSLSEVPGSAPIDETQQTLAMAGNPEALIDRVSAMTPEQLNALLDRIY